HCRVRLGNPSISHEHYAKRMDPRVNPAGGRHLKADRPGPRTKPISSHSHSRSSHHAKNGGMSVDTLPGNRGGRLSRNAVTPSFTSALWPRQKMPRLSTLWASIGWSAPSARQVI